MNRKNLGVGIVFIVGLFIVSWGINFMKLTNCDFKSDYKCEAIHGVGLIPAFSLVTVWFGADE